MKNKKIKKIVAVGGGTGSFEVLSALRRAKEEGENIEISAVVSMSDSGGSTGILMDEYGVLPPGDIRQCLVALAPEEKFLRKLFFYRYKKNDGFLGGHSFGNIFLSTIEKITNSFLEAITEAEKILNTLGRVFPVTLTKHQLVVERNDGKKVKSEKIISQDKINFSNLGGLEKIYLDKKTRLNRDAKKAILEADVVLINPGSFFTSILPNFLVGGFVKTLRESSAKKVFVVNMVTEKGHTDNFKVLDFLKSIQKYAKFSDFDFVLYNSNYKLGRREILERYGGEGKFLVKPEQELKWKKAKFISGDFLKKPKANSKNKNFIRYDGEKLVKKILEII